MHQPEPQRFRGRDALARKPVTAKRPVPHSANEERHDAEWRHADAHFGNREERRFGRDRNIAAGDEAGAAADSAALHDSHRRLWQGVECDEHIAQRGRRARRRLRRGLAAAGGEIGASAEMSSTAAQHHDAHVVVGAQCLELIGELIEHRLVESVAAVGPIERDGCDASGRDVDSYGLKGQANNLTRCLMFVDVRRDTLGVVPAKAGTQYSRAPVAMPQHTCHASVYWVPACAETTATSAVQFGPRTWPYLNSSLTILIQPGMRSWTSSGLRNVAWKPPSSGRRPLFIAGTLGIAGR